MLLTLMDFIAPVVQSDLEQRKNEIICLLIKKSGTIGMLEETWLFDLLTRRRNFKEIYTNWL